MRNPVVVRVKVQNKSKAAEGGGKGGTSLSEQRTPTSLDNYYTFVEAEEKTAHLLRFLRECAFSERNVKVIVFFLTGASAEYFAQALQPAVGTSADPRESLEKMRRDPTEAIQLLQEFGHGQKGSGKQRPSQLAGFPLFSLHGRMPAKKRTATFESFRHASAGALFCTDVAARGWDVPDVDWIIQFDPPKDTSFFVHRVGRTARAGRRGAAMVLLMPQEEDYLELLRLQRVPIVARPRLALEEDQGTKKEPAGSETTDGRRKSMEGRRRRKSGGSRGEDADSSWPLSPSDTTEWMQRAAIADRDLLERGTHAFVSFIQGYAEHRHRHVFQLDVVPLCALAKSFGLLKVPQMKELRGRPLADRVLEVDAAALGLRMAEKRDRKGHVWHEPDTSAIAFLDPDREAARIRKREKEQELRSALETKWGQSVKMAGKGWRAAAQAEAEKARKQAAEEAQEKARKKRKGQQQRIFEDWDELAQEEKLAKKLKQGKISQEEFDRLTLGEFAEDLGPALAHPKRERPTEQEHVDDDNDDDGNEDLGDGEEHDSTAPPPLKKRRKAKNAQTSVVARYAQQQRQQKRRIPKGVRKFSAKRGKKGGKKR